MKEIPVKERVCDECGNVLHTMVDTRTGQSSGSISVCSTCGALAAIDISTGQKLTTQQLLSRLKPEDRVKIDALRALIIARGNVQQAEADAIMGGWVGQARYQ